MKTIKLIVINKATGDSVWYKELVGGLFLVADCSDPKFFNVVKPVVGDNLQLRVDAQFVGHGVVFREDMQVIAELNVL